MSALHEYSEFLAEVAEYQDEIFDIQREEMYNLIDRLEPMFGKHVYEVVMGNERIFAGLSLEDAIKEYNFRCDPTSVLF